MSNIDPAGNASAGDVCRCPDCGTARVVLRRKRDHIDRVSRAPSSLLAHVRGGKLYHCIFCRVQFYSTLPMAAAASCGGSSELVQKPPTAP